jgi:hypothetical protein
MQFQLKLKHRPEVGTGSPDALTNPPLADAPRGSVGSRPGSDSGPRDPIRFMAESAPQVTPNVAAVLARIVRALRDHQKGEAA